LIDYLKGIGPARALLDSEQFTSSWTKKELLAKPGLSDRERRQVDELLARCRLVPVDDAVAEKYWILLKKYESQALRQADAIIAATAWHLELSLLTRNQNNEWDEFCSGYIG
jgi:predicted nucleic acid-binding protein